ncbi:hypothetical protein CI109_102377 [Kwoniella shandongensis]|uniref:Uncharacterized protein n=1 Tax=Kwoniella shandongensis TaxID=1734106 RepID=A0A5M6C059_9TREE|nr:uncharacterized protein CI109_003303 [Kwoniella shandongensis]KAA5528403.1 hypothetical protein CI109_003303 [Kwoniella shandongensis]
MAPVQLPNALIYLTSLFRPGLLRPHLRVPSIAYVDFRALRKEGYNGIIIDKDNCLTIPNRDEVYPPYQTAWNDLLESFRPGRVLVVSNSAGTNKDPGGIAAESVSLSLRAPVLIHTQPKPGCSTSILSYFHGSLGPPQTHRSEIAQSAMKVQAEEKADEEMLWTRWNKDVDGPILGPLKGKAAMKEKSEGQKVAEGTSEAGVRPELKEEASMTSSDGTKMTEAEAEGKEKNQTHSPNEPLRLVVIGDRLFTDTLLAHRLGLHLRSTTSTSHSKSRTYPNSLPPVLSIHTTSLPEAKDVRLLRWVEEKLTRGGRTKGDATQFARFLLKEEEKGLPVEAEVPAQRRGLLYHPRLSGLRWLTPARWREIDVPPLTWHPRSWKPLPLAAGAGRVLSRGVRLLVRGTRNGGKSLWTRGKSWAASRKERAEELVQVKEKVDSVGQVIS